MFAKKEIKQLTSLLKKIDNPQKGLPQEVFEALIKKIPFIGCELVIIRNANISIPTSQTGEILLTWRDDKWWKGWHFPGGLLRYGESFKKRLTEVAKNELGVNFKSHKFLFPINYNQCPRGHGVSLVFLCETKTKPKAGRFFKKMPKNIIREHKELWRKLSKCYNWHQRNRR